jgi:hypothetical protein
MSSLKADDEAIDVVYTWVDDTWPGYGDLLRQHASTRHDLNPNRTRDNLQILKYSLRSLEAFVPWARRVYLVTCRPQVPSWLNRPSVRLVHHDEFMPRAHLPTFNSFAIVSHLHRLPGLARRFVYMEDDRVFGAPVEPADFFAGDGRVRVYASLRGTPDATRRNKTDTSPWNLALAQSNALLDARHGPRRRGTVKFAPLAIDQQLWRQMIAAWPEAFEYTSASRFRAAGNVAPEHLFPYFALGEGTAVRVPRATVTRHALYHPVNNVALLQRVGLARLRWFAPKFANLNDNFGARPRASVVRLVRRALEQWFPRRSRFEIADSI